MQWSWFNKLRQQQCLWLWPSWLRNFLDSFWFSPCNKYKIFPPPHLSRSKSGADASTGEKCCWLRPPPNDQWSEILNDHEHWYNSKHLIITAAVVRWVNAALMEELMNLWSEKEYILHKKLLNKQFENHWWIAKHLQSARASRKSNLEAAQQQQQQRFLPSFLVRLNST